MITFATKDTVKYIKNTKPLVKIRKPEDHLLGAGVFTGPAWDVLTDGHWINYLPPSVDIQRNNLGQDTYGCESFSLNNAHRFIWKLRYNEDFNKSDRYLVVGSGTIEGEGNGTLPVAEWDRQNGWILEQDWPFDRTQSIDVYYNGGVVPANLLAKGKQNGQTTEVGYKWLKDETPATRKVGMTFSPVRTSVKQYAYDANGTHVVDSGSEYVHEIVVFDYVDGVEWWVYDSENNQYLKFVWDYPFDSSMIHNIQKKSMPKLYKLKSDQAIFALDPLSNLLVPFIDGVVAGGELYKTEFGVNNYSDLPRVKDNKGNDWDKLPFKVASWGMTSVIFDPSKYNS